VVRNQPVDAMAFAMERCTVNTTATPIITGGNMRILRRIKRRLALIVARARWNQGSLSLELNRRRSRWITKENPLINLTLLYPVIKAGTKLDPWGDPYYEACAVMPTFIGYISADFTRTVHFQFLGLGFRFDYQWELP
jgi:hypothetical protein